MEAEQLKEIRIKRGYTQQQMAVLLDVTNIGKKGSEACISNFNQRLEVLEELARKNAKVK